MSTGNNFCGINFQPAIFNASGAWCASETELRDLGKSSAGAILIKSTTLEPRSGNDKPRFFTNEFGSLNSMGLPNLGPQKYKEILPTLRQYKKPIIASIAGMSPDHFVPISQHYLDAGVDALEVNLSCPNLVGKPQIAFDFEKSRNILQDVKNIAGKTPVGVKLPPYPDPIFNIQMAHIIRELKIDFVTVINSVPHCAFIDSEKEEFVIKNKFGGLGGKYVKPVALGQVRRFYELLEGKVPIIGCGGIETGKDIVEHFLAGASTVQVGTQLMKEGPQVFARLEKEFSEELEKKNCTAKDLVGRAKPREKQLGEMLDY
ncbi:MAG: dihydroorotate oxidase [Candidatus Micrarchaeota archaeon]|nr:dihydroorotate oxidase [Candidatus Micrarchaeota archaeon]